MSEIRRRDLLLGRIPGRDEPAWRERRPTPSEGDRPRNDSLPPVISWLAPYVDGASAETPRRPPRGVALLRPPGAVDDESFLDGCTRCRACADACPHDAIIPAPPSMRGVEGTPRIDPSRSPCRMCDDFPCISACPEGVLVPEGDRMGTAHIQLLDCLNSAGAECRVCLEQCPVEGAIAWTERPLGTLGAPEVREALCVGCGVCHYACPAPQNAIAILPNPSRRAQRRTTS